MTPTLDNRYSPGILTGYRPLPLTKVATELGDALAAPTIRPGCSGHHKMFHGTVTVPPKTLMVMIQSYCRSPDEHGFEYIVLVPTHGGNFGPVKTGAPDIARELEATVIALADLDEHK